MRDIINQPLFHIVFEDDSFFMGGNSYYETKWKEIPNKTIKRIFYTLPDGNNLCLHGYKQYFHMIEAVKDLIGKEKGKVKLQYVYIMGKTNDIVDSYRITLFETEDSKYKIGDIVKRQFDINDKFVKGLNKNNWR
jgi:hypothetical protein